MKKPGNIPIQEASLPLRFWKFYTDTNPIPRPSCVLDR